MDKTTLLSYSLRYKYLSSFIRIGYKTFSCYYFDKEDFQKSSESRVKNSEFQAREVKISSKYLKLLVNRRSKVRWKWLSMLSGVISVSVIPHYDFDLNSFLVKYTKDYDVASNGIVFGLFYRKIYISWKSAFWLKNILSPRTSNSSVELRQSLIIEYAQKIKFLAIFGPILLGTLLRKFILKILLLQYFSTS